MPQVNEVVEVDVDTSDRGLFFRVVDRLFSRKESQHVT